MRKLHLKLYLAIVGTLVVFLVLARSCGITSRRRAWPLGGIESAAGLAAMMLDERKHDLESTREMLVSLGCQANSDVVLYDAQGAMVLHVGGRTRRC